MSSGDSRLDQLPGSEEHELEAAKEEKWRKICNRSVKAYRIDSLKFQRVLVPALADQSTPIASVTDSSLLVAGGSPSRQR